MSQTETIFFFDGVCGLCNRNVDFILKHDKSEKIKVAPLQGDKSLHFLSEHGLPAPDYSTSILFHGGRFFYKSDVYFETMKVLGFPWSLVTVFRFVPRFIRDFVYDLVARNRQKLFGTRETCRLPTAAERSHFL